MTDVLSLYFKYKNDFNLNIADEEIKKNTSISDTRKEKFSLESG